MSLPPLPEQNSGSVLFISKLLGHAHTMNSQNEGSPNPPQKAPLRPANTHLFGCCCGFCCAFTVGGRQQLHSRASCGWWQYRALGRCWVSQGLSSPGGDHTWRTWWTNVDKRINQPTNQQIKASSNPRVLWADENSWEADLCSMASAWTLIAFGSWT